MGEWMARKKNGQKKRNKGRRKTDRAQFSPSIQIKSNQPEGRRGEERREGQTRNERKGNEGNMPRGSA